MQGCLRCRRRARLRRRRPSSPLPPPSAHPPQLERALRSPAPRACGCSRAPRLARRPCAEMNPRSKWRPAVAVPCVQISRGMRVSLEAALLLGPASLLLALSGMKAGIRSDSLGRQSLSPFLSRGRQTAAATPGGETSEGVLQHTLTGALPVPRGSRQPSTGKLRQRGSAKIQVLRRCRPQQPGTGLSCQRQLALSQRFSWLLAGAPPLGPMRICIRNRRKGKTTPSAGEMHRDRFRSMVGIIGQGELSLEVALLPLPPQVKTDGRAHVSPSGPERAPWSMQKRGRPRARFERLLVTAYGAKIGSPTIAASSRAPPLFCPPLLIWVLARWAYRSRVRAAWSERILGAIRVRVLHTGKAVDLRFGAVHAPDVST